jgi:hypothetical protein
VNERLQNEEASNDSVKEQRAKHGYTCERSSKYGHPRSALQREPALLIHNCKTDGPDVFSQSNWRRLELNAKLHSEAVYSRKNQSSDTLQESIDQHP